MMRSAGEKLRREALKGMVGQQAPLIVERPDVGDKPAAYHGRLANYMPVRLEDPEIAIAPEIRVQIRGVVDDVLIARVSRSE